MKSNFFWRPCCSNIQWNQPRSTWTQHYCNLKLCDWTFHAEKHPGSCSWLLSFSLSSSVRRQTLNLFRVSIWASSKLSFLFHVCWKLVGSDPWWRPVDPLLRSSCSGPGSPWASAAASSSPRAGLGRRRTTSCWQTCTVCGRRGWTQQPSSRDHRYTEENTTWRINSCVLIINKSSSPPRRSWTDVCELPSKPSSPTCVRWFSPVWQEVTGGSTARRRFLWRDRKTATSAWSWRASWQGYPSTGSFTAPPPPSQWYDP